MQKYKCGKISELYISLSIDAGMKLLIFFITPIVLAILFDILFECDVRSTCSFIVRRRKLNSFIIVILVWLIYMSKQISSCYFFGLWWNSMRWHFLAFRDNLFTATQLLILISSAFMLAATLRCLFVMSSNLNLYILLINVVSSASEIKSNVLLMVCIS